MRSWSPGVSDVALDVPEQVAAGGLSQVLINRDSASFGAQGGEQTAQSCENA